MIAVLADDQRIEARSITANDKNKASDKSCQLEAESI